MGDNYILYKQSVVVTSYTNDDIVLLEEYHIGSYPKTFLGVGKNEAFVFSLVVLHGLRPYPSI